MTQRTAKVSQPYRIRRDSSGKGSRYLALVRQGYSKAEAARIVVREELEREHGRAER